MKIPRRHSPESVRERSDKKVKKTAKKLGGKLTPNSGATRIKGDYRLKHFVVEHKYTDKKSYRIDDETWNKAAHEALIENREPALEVETATCHYVVIPYHIFEEIKDLVNAPENQIL